MSLEAMIAGQPDEYPLKCPFRLMGCEEEFGNPEEQKAHSSKCIHSTFVACRQLCCRNKDRYLFSSPVDLVTHAIEEHGAVVMNQDGSFTLDVGIPQSFLCPLRNSLKSFIVGQNMVYLDGVSYPVGLMLISLHDVDPDAEPEVIFGPYKLEENTNYIHHLIKLVGKEDMVIPTILEPAETSNGRTNPELAAIQAFNSPKEFFANLRSSRIPRYKCKDILQFGNFDATRNSVRVTFDIIATMIRCKVQEHGHAQLQPFGEFWEDLNVIRPVQLRMIESRANQPSGYSKIIIPQIKCGGTVIVESHCDYLSKNALTAGILDYVNFPTTYFGFAIPCRCIVLMPSKTMLENQFSAWWRGYISLTKMTIFQFPSVTPNLIQDFKSKGADVIMSTLQAMLELMDTEDEVVQSLLRRDLRHIHVYLPDRFPKEGLVLFYKKLGQQGEQISKSAYSEVVSDEVRSNLVDNMGFKDALFVSLGPNPRTLISRHIMNIKSDESLHLRCIQANHHIRQEEQVSGPNRWLIFVRSTVLPYINVVKRELNEECCVRSVTFFTTHERVRRDPNFFTDFKRSNNGILVLPYEAMEFEEVACCDIMLLLEEPSHEWEANLVRLIVQSTNAIGSVKPIKMLSPREDGYVQF